MLWWELSFSCSMVIGVQGVQPGASRAPRTRRAAGCTVLHRIVQDTALFLDCGCGELTLSVLGLGSCLMDLLGCRWEKAIPKRLQTGKLLQQRRE
jgi:hypothetical protein